MTTKRYAIAGAAFLAVAVAATAADASVWTDWTSGTVGAPGSATGTLNGVTVAYTGEVDVLYTNPNSTVQWAPDSSWIGGLSTSSPSDPGDSIRLDGNAGTTNTITFSSAILNPVFAIWSLGQGSSGTQFNFDLTPLFQAGGPSTQYGGGAITVVGNSVFGNEGNGVVSFSGLVSSISWTNTSEFYYAFTVGSASNAIPSAIPEPGMLGLFGLGLIGLGISARRRKTK